MGGLWKYMRVTWFTSLVGSIALIGVPFTSGFYSKDSIIEAVHLSSVPGAGYAYFCVLAGVFVTAFYSFRMYFLVFHGKERFGHGHEHDHHDAHHHGLSPGQKPHESPWVVTVPLVLLAIPSLVIGFVTVSPMLFGDWFRGVIFVAESHDVVGKLGTEFHGAYAMALHGLQQPPFWLAMAGVALAWLLYLKRPGIPELVRKRFAFLYVVLENKYYFDRFNEVVFASGARLIGRALWKGGDRVVIDGLLVNGSTQLVGAIARLSRYIQSGLIYQYAFWIILGVVLLLAMWSPYLRVGALAP